MLMDFFFKIKTFLSNDQEYLFCNCCFLCNNYVIGDFDQTVLAESLKLSFDDLMMRLSNSKLIKVKYDEIDIVFDFLFEDINNSCLPTFIESFDGDFGIFCSIDEVEYLVVKKWGSSKLIRIKVNKKDYIKIIQNAIDKLNKEIIKN